jgi:hypothetical protein
MLLTMTVRYQSGRTRESWQYGHVQRVGRGTWDVGRGTWDVGRGTWDVGHGTWDMGRGTAEEGPGTHLCLVFIVCRSYETKTDLGTVGDNTGRTMSTNTNT